MSTLNVNKIADSSGGVLAPISSVMRNRIQNGAMVIDQRNAGASMTSATNGSYSLDRWGVQNNSGASRFTLQQNAGSVTPPVGFANYLGITSTSAYSVAAGDACGIYQNIEGFNTADLQWGTANAKTITISFWVRSSLTGTFGGSLLNSAGNRSYVFSYTISAANTWEQKSITVAGDTSGTWVGATNGTGIQLSIGIGTGTTFSGTAGAWSGTYYLNVTGNTSVVGTNGATFYITGVQLEVGTQATSFEYRQYGTELNLCQRYYEQWNLANGNYQYLSNGFSWSGNGVRTILQFLVPKRANPSSAVSGDLIFANSGKSATLSSGFAFDGAGINSVLLYNDSSSGWTTGQGVQVSTSTSAKLTFSSEL
jgi:hypothetical protein